MAQHLTGSPPRYHALLRLLHTGNCIWEASRRFFEQWHLSPSQFNVLNLLQSNPDGMSQTDLGRQLLTHRSNVTGLIDRLEKRGLVRRTKASSDRRVYRVVLTRAGSKLLARILPHYHLEAEQVWIGVSEKTISGLLEGLDKIAANAGSVGARMTGRSNS